MRRLLLVVEVQGISMLPTLEDGDRVLVCRYWYNIKALKQKITVFNPPLVTLKKELFIKRVQALPDEHYKTYLPWSDTTSTWVIPEGSVFVESDNKSSRSDSRSWGALPVENIVGVVILKLPKRQRPVYGVNIIYPKANMILNNPHVEDKSDDISKQK